MHDYTFTCHDGTARTLHLNEPQYKATMALAPGKTVVLPWGRAVGLSWFVRNTWWRLVAEHDHEPRKDAPPPWFRGVRILHVVPSLHDWRAGQGELVEREVVDNWGDLGGRWRRTEACATFPGGSWVRVIGEQQMRTERGLRVDVVTTDSAENIDPTKFALIEAAMSEPWSMRTLLIGGCPDPDKRYGLLEKMRRVPSAVVIPATWRDCPDTVSPEYIAQLRQTMAPAQFAREWDCNFDEPATVAA